MGREARRPIEPARPTHGVLPDQPTPTGRSPLTASRMQLAPSRLAVPAFAGIVPSVTEKRSSNPGRTQTIHLEVALVDVRDAGVEFLWAEPIQEWSEVSVQLGAAGRRERFHARGVVVACRPTPKGLWSISLFFTDLATRENRWPPA